MKSALSTVRLHEDHRSWRLWPFGRTLKIAGICITSELISGCGWIVTKVKSTEEHFVYVAPSPVLARLEGLHDGVLGLMEVLGGVLVLGGIAAAHVAADEAFAQVHPGVAHLQAFLAAFAARS